MTQEEIDEFYRYNRKKQLSVFVYSTVCFYYFYATHNASLYDIFQGMRYPCLAYAVFESIYYLFEFYIAGTQKRHLLNEMDKGRSALIKELKKIIESHFRKHNIRKKLALIFILLSVGLLAFSFYKKNFIGIGAGTTAIFLSALMLLTASRMVWSAQDMLEKLKAYND